MKWIKSILVFLGTIFLGMLGGQKEKGARRFGIFGFALTLDGFKKNSWPLVLLILSLVMGYGEHSFLSDKLGGADWAVRLIYALLLSVPFIFYSLKRWICAFILLVVAFQIHAGSFGHVSWFGDLLVEDLLRYGTLGGLIAFNLFIEKDEGV